MIRIHIDLDSRDCIRKCRAEGHALFAGSGSDIVCAAVTILIRTAGRLLFSLNMIQETGKFPAGGNIEFEVTGYPENECQKIRGITDFLLLGLNDLACEYRGRLEITINNITQ